MEPMNRTTLRSLLCITIFIAVSVSAIACGSSGGSDPSSGDDGTSSGASSGGSGSGSGGGASSGGTGSGGSGSGSSSGSSGASNVLPDGAPSVFGSWLTVNSANTVSTELTLNANGTYQLTVLVTTSTVSGDEYVQQGTFTLNGALLTLTPTEATCSAPLTPATYTYGIDTTILVLTDSSGTSTFYGATTADLGSGLTLVVGCSVNGGAWSPASTTGSPPVPADPGSNPSPYGNWLVTSGNTSVELTLDSDGTYAITILGLTSTQTANEYLQKGSFVLSGADIVFTPTEASCPVSVPVGTDVYGVNGSGFSTTDASGNETHYAPTGSATLGQGLTLVLGCSQNGGPWMPEPLAPVTN
jgi:hypothetical protein